MKGVWFGQINFSLSCGWYSISHPATELGSCNNFSDNASGLTVVACRVAVIFFNIVSLLRRKLVAN